MKHKHSSASQREVRTFTTKFQVRSDATGKQKQIVGYAAKFAPARSEDLGGFVEEIAVTAFDNALRGSDVRALYNHDPNFVIGRTKASTLQLTKDGTGLHYSITPPPTQWASDLLITIGRGDVDQSSFGFVCNKDSWYVEDNGTVVRRLEDVTLYDVSVVTYPAYASATAQVRGNKQVNLRSCPTHLRSRLAEKRVSGRVTEKRYRGVLSAVASQKWAILPEKLETIVGLLNARAEGIEATPEEIRAALGAQSGESPETDASVAVIPVHGVISQRMSMFSDISGGTSCEAISKQLKAALADDSVSRIILDIDSPGGTVTGVPELAAEILAARSQKPIVAVANGMAASAAYWIASAASKIVVIPSGEVGSVGVYTVHQDYSGALKQAGVKMTFVQAGKYKTDGNPYEPLSDSARADLQDGVNQYYAMFTNAVAKGRGVSQAKVLSNFGQGRCVMAQDALAAGMVDQIATLDDILGSSIAPASAVSSTSINRADDWTNPNDWTDPEDDDTDEDDQNDPGFSEPSDEDEDDACACDCRACEQDRCEDCSNMQCEDDNCEDCPVQLRSRLQELIEHRRR